MLILCFLIFTDGYTGETCEKGPDSLPGDSRCPYTNCSHEFDRNADCNVSFIGALGNERLTV